MKRPLFLLLLSQLAHPLDVGSGSGTRGAVEAQGGGTLLHHAIFANVVSTQLGCTCAFSARVLYAPISKCLRHSSICLLLLVDLFHFAVPVGAMVVAAPFLTLSGMGRGI